MQQLRVVNCINDEDLTVEHHHAIMPLYNYSKEEHFNRNNVERWCRGRW